MNWTKIAVLTALLFIIFTTSIFGGHFGLIVKGVPEQKEGLAGLPAGETVKIGDIPFFGYEPTVEVPEKGLLASAWEFYWDMISFGVPGMPAFFSIIFWIMNLLALYILLTAFLPGGGN